MKLSICILTFLFGMFNLHAASNTFSVQSIMPVANPKEETLTIKIIKDDGSQITLSNGSVWDVAPEDQPLASGWIASSSKVTLTHVDNDTYTITNMETKSVVHVTAHVDITPAPASATLPKNERTTKFSCPCNKSAKTQ